eukprot:g3358.t1
MDRKRSIDRVYIALQKVHIVPSLKEWMQLCEETRVTEIRKGKPIHLVAWCPRELDALNGLRCLLFDDYDSQVREDDGYVHFSDPKSQYSRADRTIIDKFDKLRLCMIRRMLSLLDSKGRTVLHIVSMLGHDSVVEYLLMKAREVWLWPNIRKFVMVKENLSVKDALGFDDVKMNISKREDATRLNRDYEALKKMFFEWKMCTASMLPIYKTTFGTKKGSKFERTKLVKKYGHFQSDQYRKLKHYKRDVLSIPPFAKSVIESTEVRDCGGFGDQEAFRSVKDEFTQVCRFCGHGRFSYDPFAFRVMCKMSVPVAKEIKMSGLTPIAGYIQFLLHPLVPLGDVKRSVLKTFRDDIHRDINRSALYTAGHFGEWEVVGKIVGALLGDNVVPKAERKSKKNTLLHCVPTRSELGTACREHTVHMQNMVPELASYCAPTPEGKPSAGTDPTDLSSQKHFKEQKVIWEQKRMILQSLQATLKKLNPRRGSAGGGARGGHMKFPSASGGSSEEEIEDEASESTMSGIINFSIYRTNKRLNAVAKSFRKNYDMKFTKKEIGKMSKQLMKLIDETDHDLLIYKDTGCCSCFGFFTSTDRADLAEDSKNGKEGAGGQDTEKLKRWRYAECSRRLASIC